MDENEKNKLEKELLKAKSRRLFYKTTTDILNKKINDLGNARIDLGINSIHESDEANAIDQTKSDLTYARNKMRGLYIKWNDEAERLEKELKEIKYNKLEEGDVYEMNASELINSEFDMTVFCKAIHCWNLHHFGDRREKLRDICENECAEWKFHDWLRSHNLKIIKK